ncbi:MAG: CvpA family protein [Muribaculum sp.]|nr:CvpA family protein [Muribaculum sp.]
MTDAIYHLTVIVLAALGAIRGYHAGVKGQIASVLGMAFGIVCAHIFSDPVYAWLLETYADTASRLGGDLLLQMAAPSIVYVAVFCLLQSLSAILRSAMSVFESGLLSSLAGGLFGVLKYVFFVSIGFNLAVDYNPYSTLLKYAMDGDGNVVELVMDIAPDALGAPGYEELAHRRRLEEAKGISRVAPGGWCDEDLIYGKNVCKCWDAPNRHGPKIVNKETTVS